MGLRQFLARLKYKTLGERRQFRSRAPVDRHDEFYFTHNGISFHFFETVSAGDHQFGPERYRYGVSQRH